MAEIFPTHRDKAMIEGHGQFKTEHVRLTVASGDTYESKLANPQFATIEGLEDTTTDGTESTGVVGKTVTMTVANTGDYLITIYGDDVW